MALKFEELVRPKTEEKKKKKKYYKKPSKYPAGKKILEPNASVTFTVADEDVVGSVVADKEDCAAAKALCKLPDIEHAWVFRTRTIIRRTDGSFERFENPRALRKAVDGFDSSAGLFPAGEYELKPLAGSNRREYKERWNSENKERAGGKRPYEYAVTSPKPLRKK